MDCDLYSTWLERLGKTEDDTSNWLKLNTKPCPKCKTSIDKNGGCMHMTCRNCKHNFCWLCLGDYANHGKETGKGLCGSYADVEKAGRASKSDIDKNRLERDLKKMEFYSNRF